MHNQLWILDTAEATNQRQQQCPRLRQMHLHVLKQLESANRHLYSKYKTLYQQVAPNPTEYVVRFEKRPCRNFNLPSTREIAAVVVEHNPDTTRGVYVYHQRDNLRQFFDYKDGVCNELTYPVLLPHGDVGMVPEPKGEQPEGHPHALLRLHDFDSPWLQPYPAVSRPVPAVPRGCLLKDAQEPDTRRFIERKYDDAMAVVARFSKPHLFITFKTVLFRATKLDELFVVYSMPIKVFIKMMIC